MLPEMLLKVMPLTVRVVAVATWALLYAILVFASVAEVSPLTKPVKEYVGVKPVGAAVVPS